MKSTFWLLCLICFLQPLSASVTEVSGVDTSYAGCEISLFAYTNQITFHEAELARCKVSKTGEFSLRFENNETRMIFFHLGVYKVFLYANPDTSYKIRLPQRNEKSAADKVNPYFEELPLHAGIIGCGPYELNFLIRSFDNSFTPVFDKYVVQTYNKKQLQGLDTTINRLEEPYKLTQSIFFKNYRFYKYGMLRHLASQHKSKAVSDIYFRNKPVLYENSSYMELFNQIYDRYFLFFGRTDKGKKIYDDINHWGNLDSLNISLQTDKVLVNDTLRELVVLKNIYDGFYGTDFSRLGLLHILDTLINRTHIAIHKQIGIEIRHKVTLLLKGFEPPAFTLLNQDSTLISLSDLKGKFIYLGFCSCMSYTCIKEFEALKTIQKKFGDKITIAIISTDDNWQDMHDYVKGNGLTWLFLHFGNQPSIIKDYDIRAYPTYFIIDKAGKLAVSPAPMPSENVELTLFQLMRTAGDL